MSTLFSSGGQSIGALASVLSMNIQGWFPLGLRFDLLVIQGTLKSLLQHYYSKASIIEHSAFYIVQLSYLYMTTGKPIALTIWTFVSQVMPLVSYMPSRFVITFHPNSKSVLISWLQSSLTMLQTLDLRYWHHRDIYDIFPDLKETEVLNKWA